MSEGAPAVATLQAQVDALRGEGAGQRDPVRFRRLEALARRIGEQPSAVQQVLVPRLQSALADFAARTAQRQQAVRDEAERLLARHPAQAGALRRLQAAGELVAMRRLAAAAQAEAASAPLKHLNECIRAVSPAVEEGGRELASARRFRSAWERNRSEAQLQEALARKPAQAGPLNSHVLLLQALELAGELSPDYLRHFMVQVETLQWLEQVREAGKPGKPARGRRGKK